MCAHLHRPRVGRARGAPGARARARPPARGRHARRLAPGSPRPLAARPRRHRGRARGARHQLRSLAEKIDTAGPAGPHSSTSAQCMSAFELDVIRERTALAALGRPRAAPQRDRRGRPQPAAAPRRRRRRREPAEPAPATAAPPPADAPRPRPPPPPRPHRACRSSPRRPPPSRPSTSRTPTRRAPRSASATRPPTPTSCCATPTTGGGRPRISPSPTSASMTRSSSRRGGPAAR